MPLRIAHVANEPFGLDTANGVQHVVHCLAAAQAELNESVAVFTRDDHAVHILGAPADLVRAPAHPVEARSSGSLRERLLSRYAEPALTNDVLAWGPDWVHFHSIHIPQNVALATQLTRARIPYCVTVHAALFRDALRRGRIKKALFDRMFERRYLEGARFIHALSPREADVIRQHGLTRPVVVAPNGLPPDAEREPSCPDALYRPYPFLRGHRVFMFIGRLDLWQKGLDLLVEGFARARVPEATLVLVGPDVRGSRRELGRLTDRLGIASRVLVMEPAFGMDRTNLLAAADWFVHPSRWEGVSLSVLAAAAAGKPCLLTREADPLGVLEQAGAAVIVEASVSSVAQGLRHTVTLARHELDAMSSGARESVRSRFTWRALAGTLGHEYRRVSSTR